MAEGSQRVFGSFENCGHTSELVNYCHQCSVSICDDCTTEHLEHLEAIDAWDSLVKEYIRRCENDHSRIRIFLKGSAASKRDNSGVKLMMESAFKETQEKIEKFKIALVKEVLDAANKTSGKAGANKPALEKEKELELKNLLQQLTGVIKELKDFDEVDNKDGMLKTLEKNVLQEVDQKLKGIHVPTPKGKDTDPLSEFSIKSQLDLPLFHSLFQIHAPFMTEITDQFSFSDGGRKFKKLGTPEWMSKCAGEPLPSMFRIRVRINKFTEQCFGYFGVCRKKFGDTQGEPIPLEENQWACTTNGFIYQNREGRTKYMLGNDSCSKDRDTLSIILDKEKTLRFEVNGKKQPMNFEQMPLGDYYFCSSLYFEGSEIEIIEVTNLAIAGA